MADFLGGASDPGAELGLEPEIEAEGPLGSTLSLTAEDIPELSDLQPGDSITLSLDNIGDDGSYNLSVAPSVPAEEALPEEPLAEPAPDGAGAVLDQFTG